MEGSGNQTGLANSVHSEDKGGKNHRLTFLEIVMKKEHLFQEAMIAK